MRKHILACVAPALLFMATGAMAEVLTKTGEVKSVDPAKHVLALSSGETFELTKSAKVSGIKAGSKVSVSYVSKDGKLIASHIKRVH